MLAEAACEPSRVRWVEGDIIGWSAPAPAALVFSTATLQWLEDHARLFPHLVRQLVPGGVLAVQMPRNFDAPSHVLLRAVGPPSYYYDLLRPLAAGGLDIWETEYLHVLAGEDPVLEWVRGSALRPVLAALPPEMAHSFERLYAAKLREAYPRRADGNTLLPFRRIFIVVRS